MRTLCEPITLVNGYRFGQELADASRAVVTMDPKARDRRLRGLGPEPVGGVPPVSVTGARPTPALAAELGPTATPTTAAVLAAFAYWIPEHEAEPVTVLVMGRRNIDVSDPPPDVRGGAGLDRRRLNAAARRYGLEVKYRTIHAAKGGEADYAVLIDSGVPRSATAPAQLALDRAIAAETGGGRDDEHELWYVALIVVSDPDDGGTSPVTRAILESADPRLMAASHRLEAWLEPVREAVPCPCCSPGGAGTGRLRGMSGRTRHFAACTNWNGGEGCGYTQPSYGACGTGMLVEAPGGLFECSDPVVPVEAAGLPLPAAETDGCSASEAHRETQGRQHNAQGPTQVPCRHQQEVPGQGPASRLPCRRAVVPRAARRAGRHCCRDDAMAPVVFVEQRW